MNLPQFQTPGEAALWLYDQGYKVFPILPNGKEPAISGWQAWAETASRKKVNDYGIANAMHNWGVYAGPSGLAIVDVDIKNGKRGDQALALLEEANDPLPPTFEVRTPSGGQHLYFAGDCPSTVQKLGEGLDTRGIGGFVVAPGSRIDGEEYQVVNVVDQMPLFPKWIDTAVRTASKEPLNRPDDGFLEDSIPDGERDNTLTRWAGNLRYIGLGEEEIYVTLSEMNKTRCNPPLDEVSVRRIAHSMGAKPRNEAKAVAAFAEVSDTAKMKELDNWPVPLGHFTIGQAPDRKWLIPDWLPEGEVSSLYGGGGTGKSLLTMQLGMAVASGRKFMGIQPARSIPFIGIFCEDSEEELHRRLDAIRRLPEYRFDANMANDLARLNTRFFLWPRRDRDNALVVEDGQGVKPGPFWAELRAYLETLPKGTPKLMALDTLSDVYPGNENDRGKVNAVIKVYLGFLAREYNLTLLILAHPSLSGLNSGSMLSGSTAWENAVRNRLAMTTDEHGIVSLTRHKSNYALRGAELRMEWKDGCFHHLPDATLSQCEIQDRLKLGQFLVRNFGRLDYTYSLEDVILRLSTDPQYLYLFNSYKSREKRRARLMELMTPPVVVGETEYAYVEQGGRPRYAMRVTTMQKTTEPVDKEPMVEVVDIFA